MNEFYELLINIKNKPNIYLGKPSLELLRAFISGYVICKNYNLDYYPDFQEFIQQKYKIDFTKHWTEIINFFSSNEEEAFYKFYEHLEEFLNNRNR